MSSRHALDMPHRPPNSPPKGKLSFRVKGYPGPVFKGESENETQFNVYVPTEIIRTEPCGRGLSPNDVRPGVQIANNKLMKMLAEYDLVTWVFVNHEVYGMLFVPLKRNQLLRLPVPNDLMLPRV